MTAASIYTPLDPTVPEIRVLKLLPSAHLESTIECRLVHLPLYSAACEGGEADDGYEALSYVWGAPEFIGEITLDGAPFLVTRNLHMALRYLRLESEERTLWVDALCINQADPGERSTQVRLMRDIYSRCKADLAWMLSYSRTLAPPPGEIEERARFGRPAYPTGEEQERGICEEMKSMEQAMDLVRKIASKDAETLQDIRCPADDAETETNDEYFLDACQTMFLSGTFDSPMIWRRVWTMQELSCAPRVVLVAGPHQLDWSEVSNFLGDRPYADAFHVEFSHGFTTKLLGNTLGGAQRVDHQRRIMRDGDYVSTLLDVLARFRMNSASDRRDCVYGLLGLVTQDHDVVVDYTKSVAQVFTEATISIIKNAGNLDVVCQTGWMAVPRIDCSRRPDDGPALPSWVPDFSESIDFDEHIGILFSQRGIYDAGRSALSEHVELIDGRYLPVKAVILGGFSSDVAPPERNRYLGYYSSDALVNLPHTWLGESGVGADIVKHHDGKYTPTGEATISAYWRTLVMDCTCYPVKRLTEEEVVAGDKTFGSILQHSLSKSPDRLVSGVENDVSNGMAESDSGIDHETDLESNVPGPIWNMWSARISRYWSFTVTDNGLFTMVRHVKKGDVLASVEGAKVPLILRPEGQIGSRSTYSLVSTAYTHGYMDGEALNEVAEGKRKEEDVLLR